MTDVDASTSLAMERTALAAENTLMGWIRTTLSMIGFGFTIGKIGQALSEVKGGVALLLVVLGAFALTTLVMAL